MKLESFQKRKKNNLRWVSEEAPMYLKKIIDNINYPVTKNDIFEQAKKSRKDSLQLWKKAMLYSRRCYSI